MKKIFFYTAFNNTASSRFRLIQYFEKLNSAGYECINIGFGNKNLIKQIILRIATQFYGYFKFQPFLRVKFKVPNNSICIYERNFFCDSEVSANSINIFEIDDYAFPDYKTLNKFSNFIVSNLYLKNDIKKILNRQNYNILVLPTVVDTNRFRPNKSYLKNKFVIVWTGYSKNSKYFTVLGNALYLFLNMFDDVEFRVVSEKDPFSGKFNSSKYKFYKWSESTEVNALEGASVGIMPLYYNEFELRKAGFKLIQYMAMNIQPIGSPVGVNIDILKACHEKYCMPISENDWLESFHFYYNKYKNNELSSNYREYVIKNYSIESSSKYLINFMESLT